MYQLSQFCLTFVSVALLTCTAHQQQKIHAQSSEKSATSAANPVISMDGRGGRVTLGDTLQQAQKAFPPPKGAVIGDAMNYGMFRRDGWSWSSEKPMEAFEVSLKNGKVVGIVRTVVLPDDKSRKKLIEQTIQKLGKPTNQATGKTAAMYTWDAKPNARFLIDMKQGLPGMGPMTMSIVGDEKELRIFNYRVDDPETFVKQMDMAAEAFEEFQAEQGEP